MAQNGPVRHLFCATNSTALLSSSCFPFRSPKKWPRTVSLQVCEKLAKDVLPECTTPWTRNSLAEPFRVGVRRDTQSWVYCEVYWHSHVALILSLLLSFSASYCILHFILLGYGWILYCTPDGLFGHQWERHCTTTPRRIWVFQLSQQ